MRSNRRSRAVWHTPAPGRKRHSREQRQAEIKTDAAAGKRAGAMRKPAEEETVDPEGKSGTREPASPPLQYRSRSARKGTRRTAIPGVRRAAAEEAAEDEDPSENRRNRETINEHQAG